MCVCQGVHVSRRNHHQRAQRQKNMHGIVCCICLHTCVYLLSFSLCVVGEEAVGTDPLDSFHALMGVHLVWILAKRFQHRAVGN